MPIFDDAARGTHAEDYALLHHGHLHFYRNPWAWDRLVTDLQALGYVILAVDLTGCVDADAVRVAVIAVVPGWPSDYGLTNWAGFNDGLTEHLLHRDREPRRQTSAGLRPSR